MALELGDYVWYWDGRTAINQNIPRSEWFPEANQADPNDYSGHGKDIYQYVIHADEIAVGQPHMRNRPGSFAWLNNNPGNITGVAGGRDYGQYPGKFNWHNFLIFPSWSAGHNAIALLLRAQPYADLSIAAALQRYAPAGDGGNDPMRYANEIASALGLPVTTRVGDLDDEQMMVMQNKIQEIEGAIAGTSLPWGDAAIPSEIAALLS